MNKVFRHIEVINQINKLEKQHISNGVIFFFNSLLLCNFLHVLLDYERAAGTQEPQTQEELSLTGLDLLDRTVGLT